MKYTKSSSPGKLSIPVVFEGRRFLAGGGGGGGFGGGGGGGEGTVTISNDLP